MSGTGRVPALAKAWAQGAVAGLVGVAAMTAGEKLEQALTGRPDSYVPARALLTLLGRPAGDARQPPVWNHLMHWGTGGGSAAQVGQQPRSFDPAAQIRPNRASSTQPRRLQGPRLVPRSAAVNASP